MTSLPESITNLIRIKDFSISKDHVGWLLQFRPFFIPRLIDSDLVYWIKTHFPFIMHRFSSPFGSLIVPLIFFRHRTWSVIFKGVSFASVFWAGAELFLTDYLVQSESIHTQHTLYIYSQPRFLKFTQRSSPPCGHAFNGKRRVPLSQQHGHPHTPFRFRSCQCQVYLLEHKQSILPAWHILDIQKNKIHVQPLVLDSNILCSRIKNYKVMWFVYCLLSFVFVFVW